MSTFTSFKPYCHIAPEVLDGKEYTKAADKALNRFKNWIEVYVPSRRLSEDSNVNNIESDTGDKAIETERTLLIHSTSKLEDKANNFSTVKQPIFNSVYFYCSMLTNYTAKTLKIRRTCLSYVDLAYLAYMVYNATANHNSVIIDNQLLIFGGLKTENDYTYELFYLDLLKSFDNTNLSWNLIPEGNLPISTSYSTASVSSDNSTIFLIGGFMKNKNKDFDYSSLIYTYNYSTKKWDKPSITGDIPPAGQATRGVIDKSEYIGTFYNDMNTLNSITMTWTTLSISENLPPRCGGYSANILSNGIIVYIGGFEFGYLANTTNAIPKDINNIKLFDTNKYEWSQMNSTGETIDSRFFHTSVLTPDGYIVIFGGCTIELKGKIIKPVSPNLAVLDTNKSPFEWSIPESSKINSPPSISGHGANLYYNYMIITFGFLNGNSTSTYNSDVYLYDITSSKWVILLLLIIQPKNHHQKL
ncbi:hypothetical protein Glove_441g64 [Diversispora epigaea]|uniref:Uncharacterized protein n=1 Tax=Diversispora epigaea TaxID=1348612 RepID=A0A397GWW1_9GLOM|nr:hypothetical protein Glove_441g64 [Diversispora epigaea]